ncbi:alanine racemase 1-like isoform X3 [Dreissena polymorpha]|uniref:alanine racemase 1-like isoform X3 n=1 Tax=Dreissena polymorpha TaxID=45954 RepID=UPI002263E8DB|nr:alanine racemase 1-like isoform X3 [Dreissena polymorpha]
MAEECEVMNGFRLAQRSCFLRINLDTVLSNLDVVRQRIGHNTGIIAVVKGNAYGHGSVMLSRFLELRAGITCFAVGTASEGVELREGGVKADVIILGVSSCFEIPTIRAHRLIPSISCLKFLKEWVKHHNDGGHSSNNGVLKQNLFNMFIPYIIFSVFDAPPFLHDLIKSHVGKVVVGVDTGMRTSGCSIEDLPAVMQLCERHEVPVHSLMTHFVDSWEDLQLTRDQLHAFLEAVQPYRSRGVPVQAANTCSVFNGIAAELDFIRVGVAMYGQPLDSSLASVEVSEAAGLRPALSMYACATKVIELRAGQSIGYNRGYTCQHDGETFAILSFGFADGFSRCFRTGHVRTLQGKY